MIRPIIFNYNMPEQSSALFEKLVHDGVAKKDVLLVDQIAFQYQIRQTSNCHTTSDSRAKRIWP